MSRSNCESVGPAPVEPAALRSLVSELILWPDERAPFEASATFQWVPTVSERYASFRRSLARHALLALGGPAPSVLEDSLGRLHLWVARAAMVDAIDLVQRAAIEEGLQCLACDDGEWIRSVELGAIEPIADSLGVLAEGRVEWIVLEGGPRELFFLQVGPRQHDGFAQAELVSNHFLPPALAHSAAIHGRLALLQWRQPDRVHSDLFWRRIDVRTASARLAAAEWLWRSWLSAFERRLPKSVGRLRLRTLSP
jgi:hypothetical protein